MSYINRLIARQVINNSGTGYITEINDYGRYKVKIGEVEKWCSGPSGLTVGNRVSLTFPNGDINRAEITNKTSRVINDDPKIVSR